MRDESIALSSVPDLDVSIGLQDTGGGNWLSDNDILMGVIYVTVLLIP